MAKGGFRRYSKVVWPGYHPTLPRHLLKVGRNDPCPCGSGKKYKECHEKEGEAWLEKMTDRLDRQRRREQRALMKAQGIPWYRRLFIRL